MNTEIRLLFEIEFNKNIKNEINNNCYNCNSDRIIQTSECYVCSKCGLCKNDQIFVDHNIYYSNESYVLSNIYTFRINFYNFLNKFNYDEKIYNMISNRFNDLANKISKIIKKNGRKNSLNNKYLLFKLLEENGIIDLTLYPKSQISIKKNDRLWNEIIND